MQSYYRSTKARGPRVFKSTPFAGLSGRRSTALTSARGSRSGALRSLRGYVRTAGFYGRFAGTGTELKFFDGTGSAGSVSNAGVIDEDSLNEIVQGAGESQRLGRKCTIKSLHIKGDVTLPPQTAASTSSDRLRFIVYLDKQTNGSAAAVTDILEAANINSYLNLANKGRFRILSDKMHTLVAHGATASGAAYTFGEVAKAFNLNLKLNVPLEFDGATGAITELRSNNIGVLLISHGGIASTSYRWRVRYADN